MRDFRNFEESLTAVTCQADEVRSKIEHQITIFEHLTNNLRANDAVSNQDYDDFCEEDALMINDSVNEFSETVSAAATKETNLNKVKNIFDNISNLMSEQLLINNFTDEPAALEQHLKLVTCMPEWSNCCFGHIEKSECATLSAGSLSKLNHCSFQIEPPALNGHLGFEAGKQCSITFSCPNTLTGNDTDKDNLYQYLELEMFDTDKNAVVHDLKEKITALKRFIRIYFTPTATGIYRLSIKFNQIHVRSSPFEFVVLPAAAASQPNKLELSNSLRVIKTEQIEVVTIADNDVVMNNECAQMKKSESVESKLARPAFESSSALSIAAGRGRLLKEMNERKKMNIGHNSVTLASLSQKRKSPSFDVNNNRDRNAVIHVDLEEQDECSMRELSSKLKKVVCVDESIGKVPQQQQQQQAVYISWLSNHLRKHASRSNSLLHDNKSLVPNLCAKFVCKYSHDMSFPIGVRACKTRNWLFVCDSSNHAVKVFNRDTGKLLHQINGLADKSNPTQEFTMHRPSAILINYENNSEIFVKDDKEILVFDLERNFRFVRRFGAKILQRPYGLAFNSKGNLVLVDANLKNPLVYVFDKLTGKVLSAKPYEPAMITHSQSSTLKYKAGKSAILGNEIAPFEKTKVRFLCTNQDNLYASDLGRSIVFKTNLEGNTSLAFGHFGKKRGEMNEPSGIHVDYDGQAILVGDSKNDRIQVEFVLPSFSSFQVIY